MADIAESERKNAYETPPRNGIATSDEFTVDLDNTGDTFVFMFKTMQRLLNMSSGCI